MIEEVVKVTRNYQVTIPASIRARIGIKEGDYVKMVYDEREGIVKLIPVRRRRLTIRLGRKVTVEEVEALTEEVLDASTG